MRAQLVVFPIKGRNWCFTRSLDPALAAADPQAASSSMPPPGFRDLWRQLTSSGSKMSAQAKAELSVEFVADKMNRAWVKLEKAPPGTVKNKIHGLGLKLLSRVMPSETFLKSVSKDITKVDITYPASLNPRLVRRRLRHIAMRGSVNHRRLFYGSVSLLPFTAAFSVLPLPNIPFFWILFRAYSNWRALKGSERLLLLISDSAKSWSLLTASKNKKILGDESGNTDKENDESSQLINAPPSPWVLQPSEDLERLLVGQDCEDGASNSTLSRICEAYHLDEKYVMKYRNSL